MLTGTDAKSDIKEDRSLPQLFDQLVAAITERKTYEVTRLLQLYIRLVKTNIKRPIINEDVNQILWLPIILKRLAGAELHHEIYSIFILLSEYTVLIKAISQKIEPQCVYEILPVNIVNAAKEKVLAAQRCELATILMECSLLDLAKTKIIAIGENDETMKGYIKSIEHRLAQKIEIKKYTLAEFIGPHKRFLFSNLLTATERLLIAGLQLTRSGFQIIQDHPEWPLAFELLNVLGVAALMNIMNEPSDEALTLSSNGYQFYETLHHKGCVLLKQFYTHKIEPVLNEMKLINSVGPCYYFHNDVDHAVLVRRCVIKGSDSLGYRLARLCTEFDTTQDKKVTRQTIKTLFSDFTQLVGLLNDKQIIKNIYSSDLRQRYVKLLSNDGYINGDITAQYAEFLENLSHFELKELPKLVVDEKKNDEAKFIPVSPRDAGDIVWPHLISFGKKQYQASDEKSDLMSQKKFHLGIDDVPTSVVALRNGNFAYVIKNDIFIMRFVGDQCVPQFWIEGTNPIIDMTENPKNGCLCVLFSEEIYIIDVEQKNVVDVIKFKKLNMPNNYRINNIQSAQIAFLSEREIIIHGRYTFVMLDVVKKEYVLHDDAPWRLAETKFPASYIVTYGNAYSSSWPSYLSAQRYLVVWDRATKRALFAVEESFDKKCQISSDGKVVTVGLVDGVFGVRMLSLHNKYFSSCYHAPKEGDIYVIKQTLSPKLMLPSGRQFLCSRSSDDSDSLELYDIEKEKFLKINSIHRCKFHVALSDGRIIAFGQEQFALLQFNSIEKGLNKSPATTLVSQGGATTFFYRDGSSTAVEEKCRLALVLTNSNAGP